MEDPVASLTIRNLDDGLKRRLRTRAASHDRSMEGEAREILRQAIGKPTWPADLGVAIHRRFAALGESRPATVRTDALTAAVQPRRSQS